MMMPARECCVNSKDGLSYSIPGQQCYTCIVFGWVEDSYTGIERELAHTLQAGYLKGEEKAKSVVLDVTSKLGSANVSDFSLEINRIKVKPNGCWGVVNITFLSDGIVREGNESLTLYLNPTPSTLHAFPTGEAVFFKNAVNLTIMDADIDSGCSPLCDITEEDGGEIPSTISPSSRPIISQPLPTGGCSPQCDITEEDGGEIPSTTPPTSRLIISQPLPTVVAGDKKVDLARIGSTVGAAAILLVTGVILLIVILLCCTYQIRRKKNTVQQVDGARDFSLHSLADSYNLDERDLDQRKLSVESSLILDLPTHLIVPSANIKLNEAIGEGEFGIVFKGYVIKFKHHNGQDVFDEYLAIKTLKGFYDRDKVRNLLKECLRMSKFDHLHVLTLKGVCLDGGPAPYIIMPFMANGSLLAYLRKNRNTLIVSNENNDDVEMVRKQLMDMCIQVAKGMEYLASMKVVHRDLAARNCMIDANHVIKIADFGLSESIGVKEYFRRDEEDIVLPLKWLALETLTDNIFSEKTDVWAYGVTCWEIFSGGKVPYTELRVREIPKQLAEGYRLKSPSNDACNDEIYSMMLQCWLLEPEKRPSFSQIVRTLSESLEYMADYMHIGAFGVRTDGADNPETIN